MDVEVFMKSMDDSLSLDNVKEVVRDSNGVTFTSDDNTELFVPYGNLESYLKR